MTSGVKSTEWAYQVNRMPSYPGRERNPRLLLMQRRLALVLLLALSFLVACSSSSGVLRAATLAHSGDLAQAQGELARLSQAQRQTPSARFLSVCLALESGDLDGAEQALRGWEAPEPPEVWMLQRLIAARRQQPALDWRKAFLQAWRDTGQPDLRESSLLPPEPTFEPEEATLERAWSRPLPDDARFLVALELKSTPERATFVLQHLSNALPPEFTLAAVDLLLSDKSLPGDVRLQRTTALREHFTQLSAAHPDAMEFPLLALLLGTSPTAPFTAEDLERLEAASQRGTWRPTDFFTLYQSALQPFEAAGLSHSGARARAFALAVGAVVSDVPVLLPRRAQASASVLPPEQLQRLGRTLEHLGERLGAQSTLVEHGLGIAVMQKGAELREDPARYLQLDDLRAHWREIYAGLQRTAASRWPLHSLEEAMIDAALHDEFAHLQDFSYPAR